MYNTKDIYFGNITYSTDEGLYFSGRETLIKEDDKFLHLKTGKMFKEYNKQSNDFNSVVNVRPLIDYMKNPKEKEISGALIYLYLLKDKLLAKDNELNYNLKTK